jgi:predicted nucleic acid-binding protein
VTRLCLDTSAYSHFKGGSAAIVVELRRTGTPIPTNGVWIAACAARVGATLLTFDRHYEAVGRVGVLLLDA